MPNLETHKELCDLLEQEIDKLIQIKPTKIHEKDIDELYLQSEEYLESQSDRSQYE